MTTAFHLLHLIELFVLSALRPSNTLALASPHLVPRLAVRLLLPPLWALRLAGTLEAGMCSARVRSPSSPAPCRFVTRCCFWSDQELDPSLPAMFRVVIRSPDGLLVPQVLFIESAFKIACGAGTRSPCHCPRSAQATV